LQRVLLASLLDRFFHVSRHPVETIRRCSSAYALMGSLVIVIVNPVVQPLTRIRKGCKLRFF
jgi:hypothetical protein